VSWPTPQEYNEAVQNPHYNFKDSELSRGALETDELGLPRVASGSFASVYRVKCSQRDVAVRCFLKDTHDQHERYALISQKLAQLKLKQTADFTYLTEGVRVGARWFPVMKMEWVYGQPLDLYVTANAHDKERLLKLAKNFRQTVLDMNAGGIAHGDLQHGNILVTADAQCKLVDYDGMFVPALRGRSANELGHRNYQHPARDHSHFDEHLDSFSAWSIYTALVCIAEDPQLLRRLSAADECLIFKQADYKFPLRSLAFFTLEAHDSPIIRSAARAFRSLLDRRLHEIPTLSEIIEVPDGLPDLTSVFSPQPSAPVKTGGYTKETIEELRQQDRRGGTSYPHLTDYIHAVSNPPKAFADEELKHSILALDRGNIRPLTGENGAVFRFHTPDNGDVAVKVFLNEDLHREERYHLLKEFLDEDRSELTNLRPYLLNFDYQKRGVKVNNKWYPVLIMEWADGQTLFDAVDSAVTRRQRELLRQLARDFKQVMVTLRQAGIVHGDIDSENIIVNGSGLKLIDYDLMRTPLSMNVPSEKLGNRHFRHPKVTQHTAELNDNFAAWVVYSSLIILGIQPDLWNQAGSKPGRLLFRAKDLRNPADAFPFDLLENHYSHKVRSMAAQLKMFALWEPEHVPMLFQEANLVPIKSNDGLSNDAYRILTKPLALNKNLSPATRQRQAFVNAVLATTCVSLSVAFIAGHAYAFLIPVAVVFVLVIRLNHDN
jgi:serine/threonine protein kinase